LHLIPEARALRTSYHKVTGKKLSKVTEKSYQKLSKVTEKSYQKLPKKLSKVTEAQKDDFNFFFLKIGDFALTLTYMSDPN
jgi:ClpP class serine protease